MDHSAPDLPPSRSVVPKVIGILALVFGVWGVLGSLANVVMSQSEAQQEMYELLGFTGGYLKFSMVAGVLVAVVLLITGVLLLKYRDAGRKLFAVYAILAIVFGIGNAIYMVTKSLPLIQDLDMSDPSSAGMYGGLIGGIVGGVSSMIFPIIGLVLLNRKAVKEVLD